MAVIFHQVARGPSRAQVATNCSEGWVCALTSWHSGLPLIVIGAILVLTPVVTHAISSGQDKERIAEFYKRNPNNATLPEELKPTGYAGYDWVCFSIGAAIAFTGVGQSRRSEMVKPEKVATPEV